MLNIRFARSEDAQAIHLILQEVWGDSLLFDVFRHHISSPKHQVFVAVYTDEIVGFLSAFLVSKPTPSWEIDILAVHPQWQGMGIGTSLVAEALTYGSNLGVDWATASIRVDNKASQRTFSKTGFTTDEKVLNLFTWGPLDCTPDNHVPDTIHFIQVDTLTYRGMWIDGFSESHLTRKEQQNVIRTAQNRIFHENRLDVGMLISDTLRDSINTDLIVNAADHGQYQRWHYRFKKNI